MSIAENITYVAFCPVCGKLLFKVEGEGKLTIIPYCKKCKKEVPIPVNTLKNKMNK